MSAHPVLWASPQPLWGRFDATGVAPFRAQDQARPALLRFATDEFMQQVIAMLEADPHRIGETLARPETWRNPTGEPAPLPPAPVRLPVVTRAVARLRARTTPAALVATAAEHATKVNGVERTLPLKLYHPAHQRFYLVAANLVCRVPGFPDHTLTTDHHEQVGYVLRRLLPTSAAAGAPLHEHAFVRDARGPHWEPVPRDEQMPDAFATGAAGEEMLPLFPLPFHDERTHQRRLYAGLIPVGRREEYMGSGIAAALPRAIGETPAAAAASAAAAAGSTTAKTRKSARKEQLKLDVTEPWKALIRAAYKAHERITTGTPDGDPTSARRKSAREANEGLQHQSWLILLDFADYLRLHVPTVWEAVKGSAAAPVFADVAKRNLFEWLDSSGTAPGAGWVLPGAAFATSMRDALRKIDEAGVREALEGAERTFVAKNVGAPEWPKFYYLLAGVRELSTGPITPPTFQLGGIAQSLDGASAPPVDADDVEVQPEQSSTEPPGVEPIAKHVDRLVQLVIAAVDADSPTAASAPPVPFAAQLRDAMVRTAGDPGWFVVRCVYLHGDCGPLVPPMLSAPSQRFQLASFFDSDAPARPIRIALPIDTTVAGLRKHPKNTAFVISDALCGQMNRLKGLGFVDLVLSVLPWPFHKDLDIGADGLGPCKSGGVNIGMICSLSIPIITICALILLFMIVLVLDLIFKWIPWFIVCFPLPKFKAKGATA